MSADLAAGAVRPFTVRDAIEATRPVDPSVNGATAAERAPRVSPDGRRFFVVTHRGILETNENEYRLQVFDVAQRRMPRVLATDAAVLRGAGDIAAITEASWISNEELVFRGAQGREPPQLWLAGPDRGLEMRTAESSGVQSFAANARGDLIYLTRPVPDSAAIDAALGGGYVVETHHVALSLYSEMWKERVVPQQAQLMHLPAGRQSSRPLMPLDIRPNDARLVSLWMAPNGRQAVITLPTADYLRQWEGYENADIKEHVARARSYKPGAMIPGFPYPQYFVIDLDSGQMRPLVVAPAHLWKFLIQPDVVWSPDGGSVLLLNTMFPIARLQELPAQQRELALRYPAILEVDLHGSGIRPVLFVDKQTLEVARPVWSADGHVIAMDATDGVTGRRQRLTFERRDSLWHLRSSRNVAAESARAGFSALLGGTIEAGIEQGLNVPPRIVVRERSSGKTLYTRALNPQLEGIELSPTENFNWTDETGSVWTGGLMYPSGFRPGRRYPLVIQTHGYNPDEFLFDSMMFGGDRPAPFTGMSARALSARGFFVLQEYSDNEHASARYYTPEEGRQFIRSYRAAIEALADRGLVDPGKVGLIGFSRTSYHVKYVLAHAEYPMAAAAIADGVDFGYFQTLLVDDADTAQKFYGTKPVGPGLQAWLREAPTFNAHKFRTPLRIEAIRLPWVPTEHEMYAALRLAGVPTELTVYPDGLHRLGKPRERYRSQQTNVDWFGFWIMAEERTAADAADDDLAAQYQRWRALRDRAQAVASDLLPSR